MDGSSLAQCFPEGEAALPSRGCPATSRDTFDATTWDGECDWYPVHRFLGTLLNILQCLGQRRQQRITWHTCH